MTGQAEADDGHRGIAAPARQLAAQQRDVPLAATFGRDVPIQDLDEPDALFP